MTLPDLYRHRSAELSLQRQGMSLLEVSIASVMSVMVVLGASSFCHSLTRAMGDTIAQTRQAMQGRIAVETLRRDLAGALPDEHNGEISRWQLVGRQIVSSDEIRLCYDGNDNQVADWTSPDRTIRYVFSGDTLQRIDSETGVVFTVATGLQSVQFQLVGNQIEFSLLAATNAFPADYVISAPDIL